MRYIKILKANSYHFIQLSLRTADDVFILIDKYYPRRIIKPAIQFFLEELFDEIQGNPGN